MTNTYPGEGISLMAAARIETLLDWLAEDMRGRNGGSGGLRGVLEPRVVVVQSSKLSRWVQTGLARKLDGVVNVGTPFLTRFIVDSVLRPAGILSGRTGLEDGITEGAMVWQVYAELPRLAGEFPVLAAYLEGGATGDGVELRRFRLAQKIAENFTRYIQYRFDGIVAPWEAGRAGLGQKPGDAWQAELYRRLAGQWQAAGVEVPTVTHAIREFQKRVERACAPGGGGELEKLRRELKGLPGRIYLFGMGQMMPAHLDLFMALARLREVVILAFSPTGDYWECRKEDKLRSRNMVEAYLAPVRPPREEEEFAGLEDGEGWEAGELQGTGVGLIPADGGALWDVEVPEREEDGQGLHAAGGGFEESGELPGAHPLLSSWGRSGAEFLAQLIDRDVFPEFIDEAGTDGGSVLERLQEQIRENAFPGSGREFSEPGELAPAADDSSMQVVACYQPMREVEALRDFLLAEVEAGRLDDPGQVLVLTPDLARYAPLIETVFGRTDLALAGAAEGRYGYRSPLAVSVANRRSFERHNAVEAMVSILRMTDFAVDEVSRVLGVGMVARKFGLDGGAAERLAVWWREADIRWGWDAEQRGAEGQVPIAEFGWKAGLDRLLDGYALGEWTGEKAADEEGNGSGKAEGSAGGEACGEAGVSGEGRLGEKARLGGDAGCEPRKWLEHRPVPVHGFDELSGMVEFVHKLRYWRDILDEPASGEEWCGRLESMLAEFFEAEPEDEEDSQAMADMRGAIRELGRQFVLTAGDSGLKVGADVIAEVYGSLAAPGGDESTGFIRGPVTVADLMPRKTVPADYICLLGMDGEAFPHVQPAASFDLLRRHPLPGDSLSESMDRYLFLEVLMNTRKKLWISYVGRDATSGEAVPPSIVVAELLDHLEQCGAELGTEGGSSRGHWLREVPLHAFAEENFRGSGSFSRLAWEAMAAFREKAGKSRGVTRRPRGDWPERMGSEVAIPEYRLAMVFREPARLFLESGLAIKLKEYPQAMPEALEPLGESADYAQRRELFDGVVEHVTRQREGGLDAAEYCRVMVPELRWEKSGLPRGGFAERAIRAEVEKMMQGIGSGLENFGPLPGVRPWLFEAEYVVPDAGAAGWSGVLPVPELLALRGSFFREDGLAAFPRERGGAALPFAGRVVKVTVEFSVTEPGAVRGGGISWQPVMRSEFGSGGQHVGNALPVLPQALAVIASGAARQHVLVSQGNDAVVVDMEQGEALRLLVDLVAVYLRGILAPYPWGKEAFLAMVEQDLPLNLFPEDHAQARDFTRLAVLGRRLAWRKAREGKGGSGGETGASAERGELDIILEGLAARGDWEGARMGDRDDDWAIDFGEGLEDDHAGASAGSLEIETLDDGDDDDSEGPQNRDSWVEGDLSGEWDDADGDVANDRDIEDDWSAEIAPCWPAGRDRREIIEAALRAHARCRRFGLKLAEAASYAWETGESDAKAAAAEFVWGLGADLGEVWRDPVAQWDIALVTGLVRRIPVRRETKLKLGKALKGK